MPSEQRELARELLRAYRGDGRAGAEITETSVPPGTPLVRQGEPPEAVFIVLAGSIRIHLSTPKGTEYLVAVEGPGELFGEVEALTGETAVCSVTSLTECRVAAMPQTAYRRRLETDHAFALLVNRIITERLRLMTRRAAIHLSYPMEYSVLKLVQTMADEDGAPMPELAREDIADYLGTSLRSINRILKELRDKGVLSLTHGIRIASPEALAAALRRYDE